MHWHVRAQVRLAREMREDVIFPSSLPGQPVIWEGSLTRRSKLKRRRGGLVCCRFSTIWSTPGGFESPALLRTDCWLGPSETFPASPMSLRLLHRLLCSSPIYLLEDPLQGCDLVLAGCPAEPISPPRQKSCPRRQGVLHPVQCTSLYERCFLQMPCCSLLSIIKQLQIISQASSLQALKCLTRCSLILAYTVVVYMFTALVVISIACEQPWI